MVFTSMESYLLRGDFIELPYQTEAFLLYWFISL